MAITVTELVESGAHFGHQRKKWNPKMKQYIYTVRKGTDIIDLQKASEMSENLEQQLKELATQGDILFVGTKKQAKDAIKKYASEIDQPYVDNRWLGGTLTNFKTIKNRIKRLEDLENLFKSEAINQYPKKEQMLMKKEMEKLDRFLGGIRNMKRMPKAVFIIDSVAEKNAIAEAKKLGIKVLGIADTDSNPDVFDAFMPANDDAIKAINLILSKMSKVVEEGKSERKND